MVYGLWTLFGSDFADFFQPDQPAQATRSVLLQYLTSLLFLLFIVGWNCPNPMGTGLVVERAETRLNRPVPNPRCDVMGFGKTGVYRGHVIIKSGVFIVEQGELQRGRFVGRG